MATATHILRHEHEAILKMLGAAEDVAGQLEEGKKVPKNTLDDLLEFFRLFADQCHHGKEEELLFPLLEKKGIPRYGGPIGIMLNEHDEGRQLIQNLKDSALDYAAGDSGAGARWATAARAYARLLSQHIYKENNVLFNIAEQVLTPQEQAQLAESFERLEVEKMGAGTHERLHAKMGKLLQEFAAR